MKDARSEKHLLLGADEINPAWSDDDEDGSELRDADNLTEQVCETTRLEST